MNLTITILHSNDMRADRHTYIYKDRKVQYYWHTEIAYQFIKTNKQKDNIFVK